MTILHACYQLQPWWCTIRCYQSSWQGLRTTTMVQTLEYRSTLWTMWCHGMTSVVQHLQLPAGCRRCIKAIIAFFDSMKMPQRWCTSSASCCTVLWWVLAPKSFCNETLINTEQQWLRSHFVISCMCMRKICARMHMHDIKFCASTGYPDKMIVPKTPPCK